MHNIKHQITYHNLKLYISLHTNILNHSQRWLKKFAMHESRAIQNQTILWITLWLIHLLDQPKVVAPLIIKQTLEQVKLPYKNGQP